MLLRLFVLFLLSLAACDEGGAFETSAAQNRRLKREADERWNGPCADESTLVATTAGSPNSFTCWNKHHRMRVDPVTKASNEEIGALVFCQCVYDDAGAADE